MVEVVRYSSVNDFGTIVTLADRGQIHGGVVQGMGQCFMESARYDETGQLLTGSFMDYALPRADDFPAPFPWQSHPVPATTNPLGAKGCGEAGCAGSMTSVMNAVVDALSELGITQFDMPASPPRGLGGDQEQKIGVKALRRGQELGRCALSEARWISITPQTMRSSTEA